MVNASPDASGRPLKLRIEISDLRFSIVFLSLAWGLGSSSNLFAAETVEGTTAAPAEAAADDSKDPEQGLKKKRVSAGLLTVALVTATGLALLALTILGGNATRRNLRRREEEPEPSGSRPLARDAPDPEDPMKAPEAGVQSASDVQAETRTPDETQE